MQFSLGISMLNRFATVRVIILWSFVRQNGSETRGDRATQLGDRVDHLRSCLNRLGSRFKRVGDRDDSGAVQNTSGTKRGRLRN